MDFKLAMIAGFVVPATSLGQPIASGLTNTQAPGDARPEM
jgi:hypothetical protein